MSKALSRVRALVSDIDSIQTQGRKTSYIPAGASKPAPVTPQVSAPVAPAIPVASPAETSAPAAVIPFPQNTAETVAPVAASPEAGKILIQLSGNIGVQLQLENSDEIVEVRQLGETIEIRFTDGKAIHLPLKNVA